MGNQNYIITDSKLLKEGGEECFDNALIHFDAAKLLSEKEMYGLACSHLVLAAEESSKAYILYIKTVTEISLLEDLKKFFRNHKDKQDLLLTFSVLSNILEKTLEEVFEWQLEYDEKQLTEVELAQLCKEQEVRVKKTMARMEEHFGDGSETDMLVKWWQQANNLKNSGFYVDINNSTWKSPKNLSKRQFRKSHNIVKTILDKTKKIQRLTEEDPIMLSNMYDIYNKNIKKQE